MDDLFTFSVGEYAETRAARVLPGMTRREHDLIKRIDACCRLLEGNWVNSRLWTWEITGTIYEAARPDFHPFAMPTRKMPVGARRDFGFNREIAFDIAWARQLDESGEPIRPFHLVAEVEWDFKNLDAFRHDFRKLTREPAAMKLFVCERDCVRLDQLVANAPDSGAYLCLEIPGSPTEELRLHRWESLRQTKD